MTDDLDRLLQATPFGASERSAAMANYDALVVAVLSPLAFAQVFACWTLFAVLGLELRGGAGFGRDIGELGFAVLLSMPMLIGALASPLMALLARRFGGRRVMLGCLLLLCPVLGWIHLARDYLDLLLGGLGLGLGAGSMTAGLVYVATLSPSRHAGLALGLYGAGMMGAGLSYVLLPLISQAYGWRVAPLLYLLPVLTVAGLLWLFARDADEIRAAASRGPGASPRRGILKQALQPLGQRLFRWRLWRLAITYSFFFGALVALTLWLPGHLSAEYRLSLRAAALWALPFVLAGGVGQIVGGMLADWRDFRSLRWWVSAFVLVCLFLLSYPSFEMQINATHGEIALRYALPLWGFELLVSLLGLALGLGLGSLMRLIHLDHRAEMAWVGGLALTLGGLFAALLPLVFVLGRAWTGIATAGFMFLYAALLVCLLVMLADHVWIRK
jgi:NNP family nitrate/nitrite transporter-like MFS transporter